MFVEVGRPFVELGRYSVGLGYVILGKKEVECMTRHGGHVIEVA